MMGRKTVLFKGHNLYASPLHAIDSDATMRSIMSILGGVMIKVIGQRLEVHGDGRASVGLPTFYLDVEDFDAALLLTETLTGATRDYLSLGMVRTEGLTPADYRSHTGSAFSYAKA